MNIPASDKTTSSNWKFQTDPHNITALVLCFFAFFFYSIILNYKYYSFGYYDWDMALYAHAMWNLCHGTPESSLFGTNFWANHSNYIALVLVPIYKIFPHPLTLITLKITSFVLGGFLLYRMTKEPLGGLIANVLLVIYFLFPANIFMLLHEFDFESLSIAIIFLIFYFQTRGNYAGFLICVILLTTVKENMPFVVIALGIYYLLFGKTEKLKWGGAALFIGLTALIVIFKILTPWARAELVLNENAYLGMYAQIGKSPQEVLLNIFRHPEILSEKIATPANLKYSRDLFGPLTTYSFLSPHILMVALPILLQNMLSSVWTMHTIFYHYTASIVPLIFLAAANSFRILKKLMRPSSILILIILLLFSSVLHLKYFLPHLTQKISLWSDKYNPVKTQMLKFVPADSSITATFEFLNELSNREKLYAIYDVYRGVRVFTGKSVAEIGESADYALIDFTDPWIYNEVNPDKTVIHERVYKFFTDHQWTVKRAADDIVLLQKDYAGPALLEISGKKPALPLAQRLELEIDDGVFNLGSLQTGPVQQAEKTIPLTFYWESAADTNQHYLVRVGILKNGKLLSMAEHTIGYSIYPTFLWKKGDFIKENFWFYVPALSPGDYKISMAILNADSNTIVKLSSSDPTLIQDNIFEAGTIHVE